MSNVKCIWNLNSPCDGSTQEKNMFQGQITVPICDKHHREHLVILALNNIGNSPEKTLVLNAEEREELLKSEAGDVEIAIKKAEEDDNNKLEILMDI